MTNMVKELDFKLRETNLSAAQTRVNNIEDELAPKSQRNRSILKTESTIQGAACSYLSWRADAQETTETALNVRAARPKAKAIRNMGRMDKS